MLKRGAQIPLLAEPSLGGGIVRGLPAQRDRFFARRLQLQERMTNQIAETIREKINPLGVAVVCEGTHLCMAMRGVEKQNSYTITSAMLGAFRDQVRTRMEFLELLKLRGGSLSVTGLPLPQGSHHIEE